MKKLRFENLYTPEYYFEVPGYDSRIAIMKFIDARNTMGMACLSLSYIGDVTTNDVSENFVRVIHLRHAIEDLNNSFDLLMQIPWFFYRIWKEYNINGSLRSKRLKNYKDIKRNTPKWVFKAEKACSKDKVFKYYESKSNSVGRKINDFWNMYIDNKKKHFTVRSLCNNMKHNHALEFNELYEPYKVYLNKNVKKLDLREENMYGIVNANIFDSWKQNTKVGQIKFQYSKDLKIDFEYKNNDVFRYQDCTHMIDRLKITDVYNECCSYYDNLIDLFEDIYNDIYPQIKLFDIFLGEDGKPNIKSSNNKIDLNDYFTMS